MARLRNRDLRQVFCSPLLCPALTVIIDVTVSVVLAPLYLVVVNGFCTVHAVVVDVSVYVVLVPLYLVVVYVENTSLVRVAVRV